MKDEHGVDVILGNPYLYIYGMPGPDTTLVIAKEFKNDKVLCFDVYSERDIELDPVELFQRKETAWTDQEIRKVFDFYGNFMFMLHHNYRLKV